MHSCDSLSNGHADQLVVQSHPQSVLQQVQLAKPSVAPGIAEPAAELSHEPSLIRSANGNVSSGYSEVLPDGGVARRQQAALLMPSVPTLLVAAQQPPPLLHLQARPQQQQNMNLMLLAKTVVTRAAAAAAAALPATQATADK